ncbi:patatin-like phospholipase family protein [Nocardia veterana]|uniref:Patatin-like phospholipase family protein n=1 Tax=Nocardia veterana TaxID=132249 RepID=A0A7X6RKH9_9NOCA|nr:patatin-like phospholipase family protein [Nocardia veterana]NKY89362.1 patatin-like phospholipase family protein [Nocardia veterana]
MSDERALVIGGGGVAGIAWANGVIAGLADAGIDLTGADAYIGTSAGANVIAQLTSGLPVEELFRRQVESALQSAEIVPEGNPLVGVWETVNRIIADSGGDMAVVRRRLGNLALAADTVPEAARRAVIESRLPVHEWPRQRLLITAVDATTGELRVFDRDSGVPLVDAVAASSAVPLVWPPHTVDGVRYTDGGIRTSVNADLAAGFDRVLIIAPLADPALDDEIAGLVERGARVELITPDEAAVAAFGANPLDTASRVPSAHAGRVQGKSAAVHVAELWG